MKRSRTVSWPFCVRETPHLTSEQATIAPAVALNAKGMPAKFRGRRMASRNRRLHCRRRSKWPTILRRPIHGAKPAIKSTFPTAAQRGATANPMQTPVRPTDLTAPEADLSSLTNKSASPQRLTIGAMAGMNSLAYHIRNMGRQPLHSTPKRPLLLMIGLHPTTIICLNRKVPLHPVNTTLASITIRRRV
jgi:hypothetical protein